MIDKRAARAGGMPLYKWLGNQILTAFPEPDARHATLRVSFWLSALFDQGTSRRSPSRRTPRDFHFDTEIIVQFALKRLRIVELPIPTVYGDEICHVNGMKYACDIMSLDDQGAPLRDRISFTTVSLMLIRNLAAHSDKLAFPSSQTFAIESCSVQSQILQLGIGHAECCRRIGERGLPSDCD